MTARARALWASRRCGLLRRPASSAVISSCSRNVRNRSSSPTCSSGVLTKNWYMAKGLVRFGIEPDRARLGLAVLGPVRLHDERRGEAPDLVAADPADVVDAHGDVAPLVAAAELHVAAVVEVQAEEVVGLQQHVAELGVGDPLVRALEAALDRLLGHHLVDREVLAHVAQELEGRSVPSQSALLSSRARPSSRSRNWPSWGRIACEVALDGLRGRAAGARPACRPGRRSCRCRRRRGRWAGGRPPGTGAACTAASGCPRGGCRPWGRSRRRPSAPAGRSASGDPRRSSGGSGRGR